MLTDIRYAIRGLIRTPGFTVVAMLTLALGIGANTALFTLVDRLLLRGLPVRHPEELVLVTTKGFRYGGTWGNGNEMSYPMYRDLRDHTGVFAGMFARFNSQVYAGVGGHNGRATAEFVSSSYFPVLGINPELGRTLLPDDDDSSAEHTVAVLSYRYWLDRLGADLSIVGKTLVVNSRALTIVGVAQKGFDGTNLGSATDVFVPITLMPLSLTGPGDRAALDNRRAQWLNPFGRLRPGMTLERAQAAMQPFFASRLALEVNEPGFQKAGDLTKTEFLKNQIELRSAADGYSRVRRTLAGPLWIVMAIVGTVLLIACANLANLLLARAAARQREFAIRVALGASRRQVIQQLLIETFVLAIAGAIGGMVVAVWGAGALLRLMPEIQGATLAVSTLPDARVLAFTAAVALLTGMALGLAPVWQAIRPALAATLKSEAPAVVGGRGRLRSAFVISQVALSMLLLVGAGLFVRSLNNLLHANLGFDTTRVLSFHVEPQPNGYDRARSKTTAKLIRDRLAASPGAVSAAFASHDLLAGTAWTGYVTIEGRTYEAGQQPTTKNKFVSAGYFATLGIPLIAGRDFDARDESTAAPSPGEPPPLRVAIANQAFVKKYLNGDEAIGRHVGMGRDPGTKTPIEIIGVVGDAKYAGVRDEVEPQLFFSFLELPGIPGMTMYVRTRQDPALIANTVRDVVRRVDPALPIEDMRTLAQQLDLAVGNDRLIANISSAFGGLAVLLAMVGLYGVLSYAVTRRTREIGVRMALGASSRSIVWLIAHEVLVLMAIGLMLALPAIWGATRYVGSALYGIKPMDPVTIAAAIGVLSLVSLAAATVPSRRASKVDPIVALRYE